jgi:hypothetical protein
MGLPARSQSLTERAYCNCDFTREGTMGRLFANGDWAEFAMLGGTILVAVVMIAAALVWLFARDPGAPNRRRK